MSWQPYRLVYQAKSPVHIGYRTLGFIQRTRYYIPGRALWGAVTANLTRSHFLPIEGEVSGVYQKVGEDVAENIKFSYFYPALDPEDPLLPEFTSQGLKFGRYSQYDFESLFVSACGQTAVEPGSVTAEEGSLHETEFISPVVEDGDRQRPVFFVGYVILNEGKPVKGKTIEWEGKGLNLRATVLRELFVGGERKYGFGRLVLHQPEGQDEKLKANQDGNYSLFEHRLVIQSDSVAVEISENRPVPAHLEIEGCPDLKGDIEPLVGREWGEVDSGGEKKAGAGQRISRARLCWVPGSIMSQRKSLRLGRCGLLVC